MFVKRKKCPAPVDRHVGGLREREAESGPHRDLNYFYGPFLPGFGQSFQFAWVSVHTWSISEFSHVCTHLLDKMVLPQRRLGRTSLDMSPLWSPGSLSAHMWSGRSPTS